MKMKSRKDAKAPRKIKYRMHLWWDTKANRTVFGVQALVLGVWRHCSYKDHPLLYATRETADRIVRWLNDPVGTEPEWTADTVTK